MSTSIARKTTHPLGSLSESISLLETWNQHTPTTGAWKDLEILQDKTINASLLYYQYTLGHPLAAPATEP